MEKFSIIPSQFDGIDKEHPVVFISYSWDNDEHKKWVRKLSDDLRTRYSINTLLDQYNRGGFDLIHFMKRGIDMADRVLLIGTPLFKEKLDKSDGGGAKFEDQIISLELYHQLGSSKFIPVLRDGKFDTSFSSLIETRTGYDFRDDNHYEKGLYGLAAELWNNPLNAAPALGQKPIFTPNRSAFHPVKSDLAEQMTNERFVSEIKRLLSSPNSEIAYTDMIEGEAKTAYSGIMSRAKYDFPITPDVFKDYAEFHFKLVERLISASIPIVRFGTLKQQQLLVDAMVRLCMKPFKGGEFACDGTNYLHLFASTFLFHAVGMACVKFGYYQILKVMMNIKVPAGNALSQTYGYSLAHLSGTDHLGSDILNDYMNASWYYPYSELISKKLESYYNEYVYDKDDYQCLYCTWEHLFSLMYNYYGCGIIKREFFPLGIFVRERMDFMRQTDNFYTIFFKKAEAEKDNWEPLKQGLFDSAFDKFLETYHKAENYYNSNGRY